MSPYQRLLSSLSLLTVAGALFVVIFYYLWPAIKTIIDWLIPVLLPFAVGAFLAVIIDPVVNFCETRLFLPRSLSILITLSLLLFLIIWGISLLIKNLAAEIQALAFNLPSLTASGAAILHDFLNRLQQLYLFKESISPDLYAVIQAALNTQAATAKGVLERIFQALSFFLGYLPKAFFMLFLALIAAFFFSRDKDLIFKKALILLPTSQQERIMAIFSAFTRGALGYLRAEIFLVSLQTAQLIVGLLLLRVKYALLFAILIGLSDFIPIVGPGAVFIPWIAYELITGNYILGLALAVLYGAVVTLRQILQPKLVAVNLGLYPLTTLIALYAGLKLLGVAGMILGPLSILVYKAFIASKSITQDQKSIPKSP